MRLRTLEPNARVRTLLCACAGRTGLAVRGGVGSGIRARARVGVGACDLDGDPSQDAVNIASSATDNCGGGGAAFEYVPREDVVVGRIDLHTDAAIVGLLDSDSSCEKPGKARLDGVCP